MLCLAIPLVAENIRGVKVNMLNFKHALLISQLFLSLMFLVAFGNVGVFVSGRMRATCLLYTSSMLGELQANLSN